MDTTPICSSCGKPLVAGAPQGLCPECLLKSGFETQAEARAGAEKRQFVPPSIEEMARHFPQFEILELKGCGGMGAVYKVRQPRLNRLVALKVLSPEKQNDPQFAERFEREARALAWLNHPNIVTVYDFGTVKPASPPATAGQAEHPTPAGLHYLVMEYVDGLTLRQLLQARQLSPGEALGIVPQICAALEYAHEQGVVHRDIKPENILLNTKGQIKITDFGIAKIMDLGAGELALTEARDVVGTPHYMAPEQVERPQSVDSRADIYSLGVVFYEMLTGELPLGKFLPPSQKVQLDARLDEVVLHSLEKEPERRYQHAQEVKTDVEKIAHSTTPPIQPLLPGQPAASGQVQLSIRSCLRRGWKLLWSNYWALLGVTLLVLLTRQLVVMTGIGLLLIGPFSGGLWLYYLKEIRGEPAGPSTAFAGFSKGLGPLLLAGLLVPLLAMLASLCLVLPGLYLAVAWTFTLPLIADQGLSCAAAMKRSRNTVAGHWWKLFGLILAVMVLNMVGFFCFLLGTLITVPLGLAALAFAYEDLFHPHPEVPAQRSAPLPRPSGVRWGMAATAAAAAVLLAGGVLLLRHQLTARSPQVLAGLTPPKASSPAPDATPDSKPAESIEPEVKPSRPDAWQEQLNADQRGVMQWTDTHFSRFFDARTFDGWAETERSNLEKRSIDTLSGPRSNARQRDECWQAINTLAALHSTNGLAALRRIALTPPGRLLQAESSNRDRWMATRALGILGDKDSVPNLIHLLYHNNQNTRWWAQISLVRLTGQNFGRDWQGWGRWWNTQHGQPPFQPEVVLWWEGQPEADLLLASFEEADRRFLDTMQGKSAPRINDTFWLKLDRNNSQHYRAQLQKAPHLLVVRPTHYDLNSQANTGLGVHYGWLDGKLANLSVSFSELVSYACTKEAVWDPHLMLRMQLPPGFRGQTNRYDVIDTLRARAVEHLQAQIRRQLKDQLGLTWRRRTRMTEVLVVQVRDSRLLESKVNPLFSESRSMSELAEQWENFFGKPVLDETGLTNRYDRQLDLIPARYGPERTLELTANNAVLARYGLELVPTRRRLEWLIMEQSTNRPAASTEPESTAPTQSADTEP